MTTPFAAIITPTSVSWSSLNGKVNTVLPSNKIFSEVCDLIKTIQIASKASSGTSETDIEALRATLDDIVDVAKKIVSAGNGNVTVSDGVVYYKDKVVNNAISSRIIWGLSEGFDMTAYINFLDNCMENPSMRAVNEFYSFLERNADDGHALGYKRVRKDFKDIMSGKFDNSPGSLVEMPRNEVDDNSAVTCSAGLHFCSISYLPQYRSSNDNRVVIVKVNPRDIVSIPIDYDHQKVRCCRYEVVSEYTGSDLDDILKTKAIWKRDDLTNINERIADDDDDYFDNDIFDDDDFDPIFDEYVEDEDEDDTDNEEALISQETSDAVRNAFDYLASQIAGEQPKEN